MTTQIKRIAVNFGGGYVPGLNAVITGAVLAAQRLGWEVVGIRDGYDGLLFPDRYHNGGLVKLTTQMMEDLAGADGCILGTAAQSDPFRVRTLNADNLVEELDRSDELLEMIRKEKIDAVISVVGSRALSILWKLSRKGLRTVCVPKSIENDVAATMLSFGFNTALSFVAEMLERARQAAKSARRIAVVEVPGEHAGWLALQAGMAVCADVVLIPEVPYDLRMVAAKLREQAKAGRTFGLVVVAEGAQPSAGLNPAPKTPDSKMKAALSPGASGGEGVHVIERSGQVAAEVALELQRMTDQETHPLVLGQLARGGTPTVVDRQLGLGYGAGAVRALSSDQSGVMVVFQPPDLKFVPMTEAINKIRVVPADSEFVKLASTIGISLGAAEEKP
ncbi:MAG TPA: 6-phosphofructokinase [Geobacteraceae bacterium]|nr:6-phosphofructokinase [Geobacteraceae bacterium]